MFRGEPKCVFHDFEHPLLAKLQVRVYGLEFNYIDQIRAAVVEYFALANRPGARRLALDRQVTDHPLPPRAASFAGVRIRDAHPQLLFSARTRMLIHDGEAPCMRHPGIRSITVASAATLASLALAACGAGNGSAALAGDLRTQLDGSEVCAMLIFPQWPIELNAELLADPGVNALIAADLVRREPIEEGVNASPRARISITKGGKPFLQLDSMGSGSATVSLFWRAAGHRHCPWRRWRGALPLPHRGCTGLDQAQ